MEVKKQIIEDVCAECHAPHSSLVSITVIGAESKVCTACAKKIAAAVISETAELPNSNLVSVSIGGVESTLTAARARKLAAMLVCETVSEVDAVLPFIKKAA